MHRVACLLAVLTALSVGILPAAAQRNPFRERDRTQPRPAPTAEPAVPAGDASGGITVQDDMALVNLLTREGSRLIGEHQTVPLTELTRGLSRTSCVTRLPPRRSTDLDGVGLMRDCRDAVVVIGGMYKCNRCTNWHANLAGGFFISPDGILATSHHVVTATNEQTLVVMTANREVLPVLEVMAGNRGADVALLRVAAGRYASVPLAGNAPVGTAIRVLSHPANRFYSLTEGLISRYFYNSPRRRTPMMSITADFAKGSSGCPVFDAAGNAVGMVSSTQSIYYDESRDRQENLQMVIKQCTPSAAILKLLRQP